MDRPFYFAPSHAASSPSPAMLPRPLMARACRPAAVGSVLSVTRAPAPRASVRCCSSAPSPQQPSKPRALRGLTIAGNVTVHINTLNLHLPVPAPPAAVEAATTQVSCRNYCLLEQPSRVFSQACKDFALLDWCSTLLLLSRARRLMPTLLQPTLPTHPSSCKSRRRQLLPFHLPPTPLPLLEPLNLLSRPWPPLPPPPWPWNAAPTPRP